MFLLVSRYNKLSRNIRDLAQKIRDLDDKDGFRAQSSHRLLEKLWVAPCDTVYFDKRSYFLIVSHQPLPVEWINQPSVGTQL